VPGLTFAPEDKEKGLGRETQVHRAQDSVIIDLASESRRSLPKSARHPANAGL